MKIEKISETQIRCTLSKKDLLDRELRISELAYGSDKAKELFREMMQQASYQFGFEAEDIPLMIEAIPVSSECLVLVITKVEDPDELDSRFSDFSPEQDITDYEAEEDAVYADEILNCFQQINEILEDEADHTDHYLTGYKKEPDKKDEASPTEPKSVMTRINLTKFFSFDTFAQVASLAEYIVYSYHGLNSLYKDPSTGRYYLAISKSQHTPEEFNKICNIISEYGRTERTTYASYSYYEEHFESIMKDKAIQVLGNL